MDLCFDKLFWLFLAASILGVIIEGLFCLITAGHWESHVTTMFGTLNFVYGIGAVAFYVMAYKFNMPSMVLKVFIMAVIVTLIEFLCGIYLKYGLGMMAWDYSDQWLNLDGIICPLFSLGWAVLAFLICLGQKRLSTLLDPLCRKGLHVFAVILFILLMVDLVIALICISRWSGRHYGTADCSDIGKMIDTLAPDEVMKKRFIEWRFVN